MTKVAIIGAGLSGLTIAKKLQKMTDVTLFEKSKGVGGRMATRYFKGYNFDHGAQFFTAKSKAFNDFLLPLQLNGVVQRWDGRFVEFDRNKIIHNRQWSNSPTHYVGTPNMNSIGKYLSKDLKVSFNTKIEKIQYIDSKWTLLSSQKSYSNFDWVISTIPAAQAALLVPEYAVFSDKLNSVKMSACFALMLGFEVPLDLPFDMALVKNQDISWISVNSSKPMRNKNFTIVINSTNQWAEDNFSQDKVFVMQYLLKELSSVIGHEAINPDHMDLQKWRYANCKKSSQNNIMVDKACNLAVAGDWTIQGRVESAFLSGFKVAEEIKNYV